MQTLQLEWSARTAGAAPVTGCAALEGAVHLRCALAPGPLAAVTGRVRLPMAAADRAFFNGYQGWTSSPEYAPGDRARQLGPLARRLLAGYALDRYGDAHFLPPLRGRGRFRGFSYCYFRRGQRYLLLASLDERPGYTIFSYDAGKGVLTLTRDCAGVVHEGGEFAAFDLYCAAGTEEQVFDGWFAALGCRPRTPGRLAGYSSWYNRYQAISQETVLSDLAGCAGVLRQGDLFQIDDGWEPAVGDWLTPDPAKFPDGLAPVAKAIHDAGYKAGLWLAPFVCQPGSAVYRRHPDWLLRGPDGAPWKAGCNWGGFYALDFANPAVRDYAARALTGAVQDWGFDLLKLDFLYAAAPFGTAAESRAGRMCRVMDWLRQVCGPAKILACGVPLMPAFGRADYCRIGCDVGLDWDDRWYMRFTHPERVSTRQSLEDTVFRRQLNGRAFGNDPDVYFLRSENLRLTETQKQRLAADVLLGSVLLTSDDPGRYSPARRAAAARLREMAGARVLAVETDGAGARVRWRQNGQDRTTVLWEK